MDLSAIIPWIPKLAATLLVFLGILIILEIRAMIRKKTIVVSENTPTQPAQITKVHFPDTGLHTETVQPTSVPTSYTKLLIIVPIVIVLLIILVYSLSIQTNLTPVTTTTPIPTRAPVNISVYRFGAAGDLELLNVDELRTLEPNNEIIIAANADSTVQTATFTVNNEQLIANMADRTPNGEVFIRYVLKPGVVDYYISVKLE